MSQAASPFVHFASSSDHAQSNCGPRRLSGSLAENTCATAPFGHTSRLRPACHSGLRSGGEEAMIPDSPNTMTSRAWSIVSPTRATREQRPRSPGRLPSTCARTHSEPARVFPAPRPPRTTQVVQSPPGGSWCPSSAQCSKSHGRDRRALADRSSRKASHSPIGSEPSKSRTDFGPRGVEVKLASAASAGFRSLSKACLEFENRLKGLLVGPQEVRMSLECAKIGGLFETLDRPSQGGREIPVEIEGTGERVAHPSLRFR
jgi:hypothetical protein